MLQIFLYIFLYIAFYPKSSYGSTNKGNALRRPDIDALANQITMNSTFGVQYYSSTVDDVTVFVTFHDMYDMSRPPKDYLRYVRPIDIADLKKELFDLFDSIHSLSVTDDNTKLDIICNLCDDTHCILTKISGHRKRRLANNLYLPSGNAPSQVYERNVDKKGRLARIRRQLPRL